MLASRSCGSRARIPTGHTDACRRLHGRSGKSKNGEEVGGVAFAGTVTRITYEREPKGAIITRVVLQKLEMIKGLAVGDSIVLRLAGGALGARRAYVDGQPTFELARRYVLIASGGLGSPDDWFLPIIGMHGGFFPVEEDKRTGVVCVHDWTHRPLVSAREDQILVEDVRGDTARVAPIGTVSVPIVVVGREMSKGNRVTEREFVALLKSLAKPR